MNILTNEEFTYRETPVDYDGIAQIDSLKGKTLVWNQLNSQTYVNNLRATTSVSSTTVTVTENRTSASETFGCRFAIGIENGHKYFYSLNFVSQSVTDFSKLDIVLTTSTYSAASAFTDISSIGSHRGIITATKDGEYAQVRATGSNRTGTTDNFVIGNYMLIDLTKMFGSGNEPTVDEFVSLFTSAYYTYDAGSLLNFNATSIKTVGKNLFNCYEVESSSQYAVLTKADTSLHIDYPANYGRYVGWNLYKTSPYANAVFLHKKCRISFDVSGLTENIEWRCGCRRVADNTFYASDGYVSFSSDGHYSAILNLDTATSDIYISASRYGNSQAALNLTFSNIQLEFGETETAFEPYKESYKSIGTNLVNFINSRTSNCITFTYDKSTGGVKCTGTATANAYSDATASLTVAEKYCFLEAGSYRLSIDGTKNANNYPRGYFTPVWMDGTTGTPQAFYNELDVTYANDCYGFLRIQVLNGETVNSTVYPSITKNLFPNGMKSAGDVYDEWSSSKAITRVGDVDLGSLTWAYDTSDAGHERLYTTSTLSNCRTYTNAQVANAVCGKYEVDTNNNTYAHTQDKSFSINSLGRLYVYDSAYTDPAAFKTAMNGVMLNYELATPTEVDAEPIKYNFYANGTEQIIPSTSAPITGTFTYYDMTEGDTPYRKFWLINAKGERWNLTERESKTFLNEPDGLGYTKSITTTRYGKRQNITDVEYEFPQPQGDVIFFDHANSTRYEKYHQFVKFLSYYPLTLYYHLPLSYYSRIPNIYTLDVVVGSLGKTESKPDNLMTCPIVFNALSFYKGDEITISGSGTSYTITNDGDFPVGCEIKLEGTFSNPDITFEQNNELYGEAKFIYASNMESLYINSKDGEQDIVLEKNGDVVPNSVTYQDYTVSNGAIYVTFVKLARGETDLSISLSGGSLTSVSIKFTPLFRSV